MNFLLVWMAKKGVGIMLSKLLKLDVLQGKKSYIAGALLVVVAVANMLGLVDGTVLEQGNAWQMLGTGLGIIGIRKAL